MVYIRAEIVRWISDDFPGFVECRFTDRFGKVWTIIEKVPVLTTADLRSMSAFPQPVLIAGEVVAKHRDDAGREVIEISTLTPWGLEAVDGTTSFQFLAEHLQLDPPV